MFDLLLLFTSSFLAATIFPAQSEMLLASLHLAGNHSALALFAIATLGNVLGSVVNWLMGFYVMRFKDRRWFPIKASKIHRYEALYQKWGKWSLLFAWLPVIGDPLTVIAGMSRVNIGWFLLLVTIGKAGRYGFILLVF